MGNGFDIDLQSAYYIYAMKIHKEKKEEKKRKNYERREEFHELDTMQTFSAFLPEMILSTGRLIHG